MSKTEVPKETNFLFRIGICCTMTSIISFFGMFLIMVIPQSISKLSYAYASMSDIKGHLEPIGSHRRPESGITVLNYFPNPKEFFEDYVDASKPALFKNLAQISPAYKLWNDDYMVKKFGEVEVTVETGKKENRNNPGKVMKMAEFLKQYGKEDIYMVNDLLSIDVKNTAMLSDIILPKSLRCGNFEKAILNIIMWFSSGGTNSVLHTDSLDNINCLFSGTKQFFMVDKRHGLHEKFDRPGSHSGVNVEAVDMIKYSELQNVPWYNVTMETGDCLFIPYMWAHNVKSSKSRNMAVNFWFSHLKQFNELSCEDKVLQQPYSVENLKMSFEEIIFQNLLNALDETGKVNEEQFLEICKDLLSLDEGDEEMFPEMRKLFKNLDLSSDGILVTDEVMKCDKSLFLPYANFDAIQTSYDKDEL